MNQITSFVCGVFLFFLSFSTQAHMTSPGQMRLKINTTKADLWVGISVSAQDVGSFLKLEDPKTKRVPFPALEAARDTVERYLASRLLISNDGALCRVYAQQMRWAQGGRRILFTQQRSCGKSLGTVLIENKILLEDQGGHRHYVQIEIDGKPARRTVISQFFPTYTMSFRSPSTAPTSQTAKTTTRPTLPQGRALILAFLWDGMWHIWIGYDHVLFLIVLLFAAARLGQLLWIVTAFTLGHTVTLILSALQFIALPERPVEVVIALSIALVAAENIWRESPSMKLRAWMAASFGLIHGFGFSYVLRDKIQPHAAGLLPALFSFNLGVEIGQIAIVVVAFPLLQRLLRAKDGRRWQRFLNSVVLAIALYWVLMRSFGIA